MRRLNHGFYHWEEIEIGEGLIMRVCREDSALSGAVDNFLSRKKASFRDLKALRARSGPKRFSVDSAPLAAENLMKGEG